MEKRNEFRTVSLRLKVLRKNMKRRRSWFHSITNFVVLDILYQMD